ncbi:MFS transporter [Tessaracoccus rhinocerotis]|uniref:MFS transporter n=1 Tax=Tessaracoccus rhinocerotis TaxID=1689449 RepID=A0A553K5E7_9ACTN|nr:MFS transporter [Tessaracoccus rhinocerotis]TRY19935.1 MFS transporter [Tessaracoccus rhinocerotis]
MRTFHALLANTLVANIATNYIWFAVTFWVYLETRSVLATGILGGAYMALLALLGVPFGTFVDRHQKRPVLAIASLATVVAFALAFVLMLLAPDSALLSVTSPGFWAFVLLVLLGCIVESVRSITLSSSVTLLVEPEGRDRANGLVGMVNGVAMLICSVLSGLSVGLLGMQTTLLIGLLAMIASMVHVLTLDIPRTRIEAEDHHGQRAQFRLAWRTVVAIPGLLALIVFSTFNNFLGGTYMALLDPYGLELVSVEWWGILYAFCSVGFVVGGAVVAKRGLGGNPIRTMLLVLVGMWIVGMAMSIRESVVLLAVCMFIYMAIVPAVEAAEQTVLQRTVPFAKQGRVFGLAQSMELAASPISAFLVAPLAEFWLLPYMREGGGQEDWAWLLGHGEGRGIAMVFLLGGLVGLAVTVAAFFSPAYRRVSRSFAETPASMAELEGQSRPTDLPGTTAEGLGAAGRAVPGAIEEHQERHH